METKTSEQHIVADPAICHGEPTFRGTHILVADVLEPVESGMAYEAIIEEWRYESDKRCDCRKPVRMARDAPAAYGRSVDEKS